MEDPLTIRARELRERREPFVYATVVRAQRPTSAHAGDSALVRADGTIEGFVGGNCVEASVRDYSLRVLASQEPVLLRVLPGEPPGNPEEGVAQVVNACLSGGAVEIFLQPQLPAPRVVVVGTTPIADALVSLGEAAGLHMERAAGGSTTPRADDAALIVASHGREEEPALEAALQAGVPYVALVASRTRGRAVLDSLDTTAQQRSRVHNPAGLDLGARAPGEVALSILAQLVAERAAQRSPGSAPAAVPASAIDPVCGMSVAAVAATLHTSHGGSTVYFCSAGCRKAFLADPGLFAAGSGGMHEHSGA